MRATAARATADTAEAVRVACARAIWNAWIDGRGPTAADRHALVHATTAAVVAQHAASNPLPGSAVRQACADMRGAAGVLIDGRARLRRYWV